MARLSSSTKRYVLVPATPDGGGPPYPNGPGDSGVRFRRLGLARVGDRSRSALGEPRHARLEQLAFAPGSDRR